ncbi:MAG: alanyl-tRNA editing protein [Clostridiales bacterium]|nr:alanyl-tRNA editing protein [Candidatus Equinaster intestinalis]
MKTVRLYDEDAYLAEFSATVLSCEEKSGKFSVCLDKTAFFPTAGGQEGDTGSIGNAKVSETLIENGIIYHICEAPLEIGKEYPCFLNFKERFDKMQNHSGEHIISGIVHSLFGYDNTGFHLSNNIVTLDFNGMLTQKEIKEIEIKANEAVQKNAKITAYYPDDTTLKSLNYRSKLDLSEDVRIVEIEGIDLCACCAPHVKSTGEIGFIKICSAEKHKEGVRLSIKCGMRAVLDYMQKADSVSEISALLCAKPEEVADAVKSLKQNLADTSFSLTRAKRENLKLTLSVTDSPCIFLQNATAEDMRFAGNLIKEKQNIGGVFSKSGEKYSFVCVTNGDTEALRNALCASLSASCGGRNGMITGSTPAERNEIEKFFKENLDI